MKTRINIASVLAILFIFSLSLAGCRDYSVDAMSEPVQMKVAPDTSFYPQKCASKQLACADAYGIYFLTFRLRSRPNRGPSQIRSEYCLYSVD